MKSESHLKILLKILMEAQYRNWGETEEYVTSKKSFNDTAISHYDFWNNIISEQKEQIFGPK